MRFEAGTLSNPYPIRPTPSGTSTHEHSLAYSKLELGKIVRLFARYSEQLQGDSSQLNVRSVRAQSGHKRSSYADMVAREFARFSYTLSTQTGLGVSRLHLESAYALLCRRVEAVPRRNDRIVVSGLACTALACIGVRVHLIVDSDLAMPYLSGILLPLYECLGYGSACIVTSADEATRADAYQQAITLVSARECAMDFLRDAVNWPQRSNPALAKIDRLRGAHAQSGGSLMKGLPCAVMIDTDSTLIDNARTPLALTQDAHPMHEVDELKQALEMVEHLQAGTHFVLQEGGAEVGLTPEGKQQLDAWSGKLGGSWGIPHIAEIMLAVAIVVTLLLKRGTHYQLRRSSVVWLVEDALVPGMKFYTKAFLQRVIELKEGCEVGSQREVAARASYQQIFNRYIHLCGCCHSLDMISRELRLVYGLKSSSRWPSKSVPGYSSLQFFKTTAQKLAALKTQLLPVTGKVTSLVLVSDNRTLGELADTLSEFSPRLLRAEDQEKLVTALQPGAIVLGLTGMAEHLVATLSQPSQSPVSIIVFGRSGRRSEDLRNMSWIADSVLRKCECSLMLSAEDDLFSDSSFKRLESVVRIASKSLGMNYLEGKIRRIHARRARESFAVRQGLLNHDTTMHSMLSFSGRGLYE